MTENQAVWVYAMVIKDSGKSLSAFSGSSITEELEDLELANISNLVLFQ